MNPTNPTAMRIHPTTSMSTVLLESWLIANVRIAPTAIRIRLTGRPTRTLWPAGVKQKLSRDACVVSPRVALPRRVLLQRPHLEADTGDRGDELAETPTIVGEV